MADERVGDLVSTTDSLEAVGVLKAWKNGLFLIAIILLCILQVCFWVIDSEVLVDPNTFPQVKPSALNTSSTLQQTAAVLMLAAPIQTDAESNTPNDVNAGQANAPAAKSPEPAPGKTINLKFEHVAWVVRVCNFVLILTAAMYFLTILFSLKISLVGRLGGINHITRGMLWSLLALLLLLPWHVLPLQNYWGYIVTGWIFAPEQVAASKNYTDSHPTVLVIGLYYIRYVAMWVLILIVMFLSLVRTNRWSKATMRRLGVM